MNPKIKPYKDNTDSKKSQVEQMFDNISGSYDGLNRIISLGIDLKWRKKVVQLVLNEKPKKVLDVATGTADLAIAIAQQLPKENNQVIGLDISTGMLDMGQQKVNQAKLEKDILLQVGDAENIPYQDNYFDAITVSFGIRNFENLDKGLTEIYRVLKPGGLFVILETAVPQKFPFKQGYQIHTKLILPLIGKLFSKDKKAYSYLSESACVFPCGEALNKILRKNEFKEVKDFPQTCGAASIYTAKK